MAPVHSHPALYMVSACLIGLCSRYDGQVKPHAECRRHLEGSLWIPFCPEQMGGLATPRPAAELVDGDGHDVLAGRARVITREGIDVSTQFIRGAEQSLFLAGSHQITSILLKSGSPSCGLSAKIGVTAALLVGHGFELLEF